MKIILLLFLFSCTVHPKVINPKVSRIVNKGNHVEVYFWYRDSWYVRAFDKLPDSIKKGSRITLYPGDTTFKRVGNRVRAW